MKKLIIATAVIVLAGVYAGDARDSTHGAGTSTLMEPASPTAPPSLAPDPRLTGSAPLPPHHQPTRGDVASLPSVFLVPDPEDAKVDRMIGNICRGC